MSNFSPFGQQVSINSYDELEQYCLAKECISNRLMETMDMEMFFRFMDGLCEDVFSFTEFAKLLKTFVTDKDSYLDSGMEFRRFTRKHLEMFLENEASQIMTR